MLQPSVWVDGRLLDHYGDVQVDSDSTIFRTDDWSGDFQAQSTVRFPSGWAPSWLRGNAQYWHVFGGARVWGGLLSEPQDQGGGVYTLAANGYGSTASAYPLVEADTRPLGCDQIKTTKDVNAAIDYWTTTKGSTDGGFLLRRNGTAFTALDGAAASADSTTRPTLLDGMILSAKAAGLRVWVDSWGGIALVADPLDPMWMTTPGTFLAPTADDNYFSAVEVRFVYAVTTPTDPNAEPVQQVETVTVEDTASSSLFGYRATQLDLTKLGVMTFGAAQAQGQARLDLIGGRMGWTAQVGLTAGNTRRAGFGPASPFPMQAGQLVVDPGVVNARGNPTVESSARMVGGQVERRWKDGQVVVTPVGFVPRDLSGILAAPEPPAPVIEGDVAA